MTEFAACASRSSGKMRDAESGLDYFGARYYASNMGRWMSPDWADKPEAVPYSQLDYPQSLNLYGYVNNNPLSKADPDGHCPECTLALAEGFLAESAPEAVGTGPVGWAVWGGAALLVGGLEIYKNSDTIRKEWEAVNGVPWPKDPATGKN